MDYDELFPGRFLKSGEFKGRDVTLTITTIRTEDLPQDKGGTKIRGILGFKETKKELVLNRTNGECLKGMFGRKVDVWKGKRLTLFPAPYKDNFTGEATTAIRVRGSPDIAADMEIEVKLPRKSPFRVKMIKTGPKPNGRPTAPPSPPPAQAAPSPFEAGPAVSEPPDDVPLPGEADYPEAAGEKS